MEGGSEEFAKLIGKTAQDRLTKSASGITYALREQGGVKIAEDDTLKLSPETQIRVTSLLGVTELTSQLRYSLFEQASQGVMTDSSKLTPEQRVVTNQDRFVQELLGNNPKLLDKLAAITAKARVFSGVLKDQESSSERVELGNKVEAWEHTIDEIAQSLCSNDTERTYYQNLVENNVVRLNNPTVRPTREVDGQPAAPVTRDSYVQRIGKLIERPRVVSLISSHLEPRQGETLADNLMDEYLETAFTLNAIRVLDRVQRPLGFNGKFRKLTACLEGGEADPAYTQIIEDNNLTEDFNKLKEEIGQVSGSSFSEDEKQQKIQELNDQFKERCRPVIEGSFNKETDTEEVIDLVGTKQRISALQQQAQEIRGSDLSEDEKKDRLANLDRQMQALFVPIANKVDRIFPHQSSTNLAEVLENEDAICAGKVNVLLAISKYLGVNARANSVKEILDNRTEGHVCFEGDLPSGNKLVIDANFGNRYGLEDKTDDELVASIRKNNPGIKDPEVESALKYRKLATANSRFIPTDARVLMYITENTFQIVTNPQQEEETRQAARLVIRTNPYNGQHEIWKANIPYPHLITAPDKDGYLFINSSFTNNTAQFIKPAYKDVGIYLFRKHIEMSPYDTRAYTGLARQLPREEGLAFLEKARREKSTLYWEGMSTDHALMYAYEGNLDRASQIFEETKTKNPQAYYKKIHDLARKFRYQADEETGEKAEQYRTRAMSLMEEALRENPALFYSESSNIMEINMLYDDQTQKRIEVYEEFSRVQVTKFWDATSYFPPFQELMELYLTQGKKDPSALNRAAEFANEIKTRERRFYAKKVHQYASGLYLHGEQKDPVQAVVMLEEARTSSPGIFFQEDNNISALAWAYRMQEDDKKTIGLYEEVAVTNPELFWNGIYGSIYDRLANLYARNNQVDKAITICEEAKGKTQKFWEASYTGGYSQLVNLYAEAGRLPEAIATSLEAETKDPNFYNTEVVSGGYVQLASIYDKAGQTDQAIDVMVRGQQTDESFWIREYGTANVFTLLDIYEKSGKIGEAISLLEQVKDRDNRYLKTDYYRICELYEKSGDTAKANQIRAELIGTYEELKTTEPEAYYASSDKLARLYQSEGQIEKAIQAFEDGQEHDPYFPISNHVALAELYLQIGDMGKARQAYQDAVDRYNRVDRPEYGKQVMERAMTRGIGLTSKGPVNTNSQ